MMAENRHTGWLHVFFFINFPNKLGKISHNSAIIAIFARAFKHF